MMGLKAMYKASRRFYVQRQTPIEKEVNGLIDKVEKMGAHEKLTDTVIFLHDAFNSLADWEDAGRPGSAERP